MKELKKIRLIEEPKSEELLRAAEQYVQESCIPEAYHRCIL